MANIKEKLKSVYEELEEDYNADGLINFSEVHYNSIKDLVAYKHDYIDSPDKPIEDIEGKDYIEDPEKRKKDYHRRINSYSNYLLSTFFKIDAVGDIYETYRAMFAIKYLDNTDDDTNDYTDKTMQKLNRIQLFIDSNSDREFTGIELLSEIRKTVNGTKSEGLEDPYYDTHFEMLKGFSDRIRQSDIDTKMELMPHFLVELADMQNHLFRKKLFEDDYRKSVTGITNYLLTRARVPLMYVKPFELEDYYEYIKNVNDRFDNSDLISFYQEKMSDTIITALILPMKDARRSIIDLRRKALINEPDTGMDAIRVE